MKPEKLQAIRERVDKATPGPWHFASDDSYQLVNDSGEYIISVEDYGKPELGFTEYNADFVINARQDVQKLLDEVERLRIVETEFNRQIYALDNAEHEITRKDAEIRELCEQKQIVAAQWLDHESTIQRQAKEIQQLRAALQFFADSDNYTEDRDEDGYHAPAVASNGLKIARQALEGESV